MILADTNILLRLTRSDADEYPLIKAALKRLRREGIPLCYTSQNLIEFWRVLTRPKTENGFGLPVEAADHEAKLIETRLDFLPDTPAVHEHWRRLVVEYRVSGRQVHDARLVAVMLAHGILRLLTLNVGDFERYGSLIAPVHPRELAQDVEAR